MEHYVYSGYEMLLAAVGAMLLGLLCGLAVRVHRRGLD